jgi:thiol:disulfide interchange protein DsbD
MGVLFFAIAAFAVALPKSGAWMEAVKSVFGVVMVVAALYFLRNVIAPLGHYGRPTSGWLAIQVALIAVGLALGGVHRSFHSAGGERLRKALGVAALAGGAFGVLGWLLAPKASELRWLEGEQAAIAEARAHSRPALLDFYADWCLPCKELELKTFSNPEVARELERFTLAKVNCTSDEDPSIVALKSRYGADTLPTLVLLRPNGAVARKIDHFVAPDEFLKLLRDGT